MSSSWRTAGITPSSRLVSGGTGRAGPAGPQDRQRADAADGHDTAVASEPLAAPVAALHPGGVAGGLASILVGLASPGGPLRRGRLAMSGTLDERVVEDHIPRFPILRHQISSAKRPK